MAPRIPNLEDLLRYLRSQLTAPPPPPGPAKLEDFEKERVMNLELEQLEYNLGAAGYALERLECEIQDTVARVLAKQTDPARGPTFVLLLQGEAKVAAWMIDQFLDAGRRAQNALVRYVARVFKAQLPLSLNDYIRDAEIHSRKVPAEVRSVLEEYWRNGGEVLKHYRDLGQHFAIVSSDAAVYARAGDPRIRILLPNDPSDKALARLSFREPYVHAGPYCRNAMRDLVAVSYRLAYLLLRHTGLSRHMVMSLLRHPVTMGANADSLPSPVVQDFRDLMDETMIREFAASAAAFGQLEEPPLTVRKGPPS